MQNFFRFLSWWTSMQNFLRRNAALTIFVSNRIWERSARTFIPIQIFLLFVMKSWLSVKTNSINLYPVVHFRNIPCWYPLRWHFLLLKGFTMTISKKRFWEDKWRYRLGTLFLLSKIGTDGYELFLSCEELVIQSGKLSKMAATLTRGLLQLGRTVPVRALSTSSAKQGGKPGNWLFPNPKDNVHYQVQYIPGAVSKTIDLDWNIKISLANLGLRKTKQQSLLLKGQMMGWRESEGSLKGALE